MIVDDLVKAVIDYLKSQRQLELLSQVAEKLTQAGLTATDPNLATVSSAQPLTLSQKQALKKQKKLRKPKIGSNSCNTTYSMLYYPHTTISSVL